MEKKKVIAARNLKPDQVYHSKTMKNKKEDQVFESPQFCPSLKHTTEGTTRPKVEKNIHCLNPLYYSALAWYVHRRSRRLYFSCADTNRHIARR